MTTKKVVASSYTTRKYGSSTVTRFYVFYADDRNDASKWEMIEGFGKTPGDRKTYAITKFRKMRGESVTDPDTLQHFLK
jgi:hypothetical protein